MILCILPSLFPCGISKCCPLVFNDDDDDILLYLHDCSHRPPVKSGLTMIPNSTCVTPIAGLESPASMKTRMPQPKPPPSSAAYVIAPTVHPYMSMSDTHEGGRLSLRRRLRLVGCPLCFAHQNVCCGESRNVNWHK